MGAPALTSRGFIEDDFRQVADFVDRLAPELSLVAKLHLVVQCENKPNDCLGQLKCVSLSGSHLSCHAACMLPCVFTMADS